MGLGFSRATVCLCSVLFVRVPGGTGERVWGGWIGGGIKLCLPEGTGLSLWCSEVNREGRGAEEPQRRWKRSDGSAPSRVVLPGAEVLRHGGPGGAQGRRRALREPRGTWCPGRRSQRNP